MIDLLVAFAILAGFAGAVALCRWLDATTPPRKDPNL